jgi:hypothetical protein
VKKLTRNELKILKYINNNDLKEKVSCNDLIKWRNGLRKSCNIRDDRGICKKLQRLKFRKLITVSTHKKHAIHSLYYIAKIKITLKGLLICLY